MNTEKLKELLDSLTDEQREKVKGCKDSKELLKLLSAEGVALPDELLDEVSGGVRQKILPPEYAFYYDEPVDK